MGDRKLHLTSIAMPAVALTLCLAACSPQDAKAPATDAETASQDPAAKPGDPTTEPTIDTTREPEPPPPDEQEVLPPSPPPPPPPPPLPVCPGDPRCEGKVIKR